MRFSGRLFFYSVLFVIMYVAGTLLVRSSLYKKIVSKTIIINYDHYFSQRSIQLLNNIINQSVRKGITSKSLKLLVQKSFPVLNITINRFKYPRIYVRVQSEVPWLMVRHVPFKKFVISRQGNYVSSDCYDDSFLEDIPILVVAAEEFSDCDMHNFIDWVKTFDENFFLDNQIVWNTKHEIIINNKKYPGVDILATTKTNFNKQLESKIDIVAKKFYSLHEKKNNKKKLQPKSWIFDVRFKNKIIIRPKN